MKLEVSLNGVQYEIDNHFTVGMEYDLLRSIEHLLSNRRVKELRVRYPKGYNIRLTETIDYLELFGYALFTLDGKMMEREGQVDGFEFVARVKDYTQIWNKEFIKSAAHLPKFNFALEVGCFEGLTTNYICDHLLVEGGRIICVDPLEDSYPYDDPKIFIGQYDRFLSNTRGRPVELMRMTSDDAARHIKANFPHFRFDFIYIDGDHREESVYKDGNNYWDLCKIGGYILFDDYQYTGHETAKGIDRALEGRNFKVIASGYQLLIQRV